MLIALGILALTLAITLWLRQRQQENALSSPLASYLPSMDRASVETNPMALNPYNPYYRAYIAKWMHRPLLARLAAYMTARYAGQLEELIQKAGLSASFSVEEAISMKVLLVVGGILVLLLGLFSGVTLFSLLGLLSLVASLLAIEQVLRRKASQRYRALLQDLPQTLGLMAILKDTALSIPEMLRRIANQREVGPLAYEFRLTLRQVDDRSASFTEALEAMAFRCGVPALTDALYELIYAYQGGMDVGPALERQSQEILILQSLEVEKIIKRRQVTTMLPIMLFNIFPMMVVLMAPAALSILHSSL